MTLSQVSEFSYDDLAARPLSELRILVEVRLGRSLRVAATKKKCIELLQTNNLVDLWTAAAARGNTGGARSGPAVPQGAVPSPGVLGKFSRDLIKDACLARAIAPLKSEKKGDLVVKLIAGWDIRCERRVSSTGISEHC